MAKAGNYNHLDIESKWQKKWEASKIYSPNLKEASRPFYNLMMFPYPSAEGLHVGNTYAFTGADIFGRFMRMRGHDVFEPIGLDGFGIHSENYAIKVGQHPIALANKTKERFYKQLHLIGSSFDWSKTLETYDPDYYKWTQWIFVKMFKSGLAYRKKANVNWCPSCKTVLSDEQVIAGNCERCSAEVETKALDQWFFRLASGKRPDGTLYPDALLNNLEKIDWSQKVKVAQRNWIGRSEGAKIRFELKGGGQTVEVFTTRPDTLNGATFLVLSPDSSWIEKLTTEIQKEKVSEYIKSVQRRSDTEHEKVKTGVFAGSYVKNPETGKDIGVWVADYVVSSYGSGAIMGVPAHDLRDMEFAKKFDIEVLEKEPDEGLWKKIEEKGWGERFTNYHLRDWLISRQRYWGPPIPMIYCESCHSDSKGERDDMPGWYAVSESDLPVELPYIEDYRPRGTGVSPLAQDSGFYKVKCPGCGKEARRETDVSDTFLDSAWYFLRYPSVDHKDAPWDPETTKKWLPVNSYIGGAEHAVLHLMYARFMTMVFYDWGLTDFEEPFSRFYAHGLLIKEGAKISKSKGNIIVPDEYIEKYGADTLRTYLMFLGPYDAGGDFRDTGIEGMNRFLRRVWALYEKHKDNLVINETGCKQMTIKLHQTIKKVTEDIQNLRFNTAIAAIMELVNLLYNNLEPKGDKISNNGSVFCKEWEESLKVLPQLLAPFAPHLAEEIWVEALGEKFSVHLSSWPKFNTEFIEESEVTLVVQVDARLRGQLRLSEAVSQDQSRVEELAKKDSKASSWLKGKKVRKVIFVPGKLINFVLEN